MELIESNQVMIRPKHQNEYRSIINNHPDLICKWLPDGTLIFANKSYCKYFGKSPDALVGLTCLDYIHPNDKEKLHEHIASFHEANQQKMIELQIINTEGEIRWHQWIDKYLKNEETGEWEFLSTGRDITDLKIAELELLHRHQFEHLITKLSIDFINLTLDDIDSHINMLLSEVGQYVAVDRSYVFIFDPDSHTMSNTHEWCQKGIEPQITILQDLNFSSYDYWVKRIKHHETILISDLNQLPDEAGQLRKTLEEGRVKSTIGIPLVNAGHVLGFMGFDSVNQSRNWTTEDINILKIVSGIIGNAFIQRRNQEELQRQRHYLEQINEITMASLNTKNVEEMINVVASKILALINADNCSIDLWDEIKHKITGSAYSGFSSTKQIESAIEQEDFSLTERVLTSGEAIVLDDVSTSDFISKKLQNLFQTKSLIALPLIADNHKLGAVIFGFNAAHKFTDADISLSKQASYQISQALLKQKLLENAQKSAQEAEKLHMAGSIVASNLDPNIAISSILDQLEEVVPFESASIQILNNDHLEIRDGRGWPAQINPVGLCFSIPGDNPNSKVILTGKPYILNNAPDIYGIFGDKNHSYIRSWLGVPLKVRDRVIGMLTLDHSQPNFYENEQLVELVTAFAAQVAISLENARLYDNERRRGDELEALRATTADITKELGLKNLLGAILQRATDLLHASGGELGLVNPSDNTIQILFSHNMGTTGTVGTTISMNEGLMGYVAHTQQIEMLEDYKNWEGQMDSYQESPIHAAIAAPLMIGKRFLGVIGIMNSDRTRKFTGTEKDLMSMFAQQAAIAVENAQLFEKRKQEARLDLTTGIYNRRGLNELGCREIDRSVRFKRSLGVIFLDIDHFKVVNDTYGHPVGDLVLQELALRLKASLRSIDILSRYGGEEFVILLPETNAEGALDVAERIRKTVEEEPFSPNDLSLWITVSQGVTALNENNNDLQQLIQQADEATYQSKDAGRNLVTLYDQYL